MNSEIDTQALIETALKDGKKVFAPKVESEKLIFLPVLSVDGPWQDGPFGIREPIDPRNGSKRPEPAVPGDAQAMADSRALLIIAPGIAFDREGNRLGRGKGYYDRFFAEMDEGGREYTSLGLCMDFQLVDQVPAGEQDKKMHGILTGREMILP